MGAQKGSSPTPMRQNSQPILAVHSVAWWRMSAQSVGPRAGTSGPLVEESAFAEALVERIESHSCREATGTRTGGEMDG